MLNLTQHQATAEQRAAGVVDLDPTTRADLGRMLTFEGIPSSEEIHGRAVAIAQLAAEAGATEAMIGGAPYLMARLESALYWQGIRPYYAFSQRKSVETVTPNGVEKRAVFVHLGFVPAVERDSWA